MSDNSEPPASALGASSSSILNALLASSTTRTSPTVKALTYIADTELELLKYQQAQLQHKLVEQQLINSNLYQSLIDSGIIKLNNVKTLATSTRTAISNLIQMLQQQQQQDSSKHQLSSIDDSGGISDGGGADSHAGGGAGLSSILPVNDIFNGLSYVFEKLFGTKFWIYAILILFALFMIMFACFCMYCCCCSRIGRSLCCIQSKLTNCFSSSSKSSKSSSSFGSSSNKKKLSRVAAGGNSDHIRSSRCGCF